MKRPHFVIVAWGLAPGGTLSVLREWVPRLQAAGRVSVVTLGPNRASLDVPTVEIGRRWSHPLRFPQIAPYILRMAVATVRAARRGGTPILMPQDSLATGAAAAIAARFVGARLAVMEHGSAEAIGTRRFWRERYPPAGKLGGPRHRLLRAIVRRLNRWVVHRTDVALIAGNEAEATYRSLGIDPSRIARYRFAVDVDRFRPATASERAHARQHWRIEGPGPVVVTVGRLAAEKGVDDILAAMTRQPAATLLVAGEGPLRESLERSAGENVRFLGRLEADEVASLHRAADLFVYAGRQGANTPYAVLEAMASGLPVVATTAPEVHRPMLAEGRGIAVPPDDADALERAIGKLLTDPERRLAAGARARVFVEANHTSEMLDQAVAAFVARILG
ncbi:MAG: glycosyltransferase family 4 protein [Chloroflexota bacterium]